MVKHLAARISADVKGTVSYPPQVGGKSASAAFLQVFANLHFRATNHKN